MTARIPAAHRRPHANGNGKTTGKTQAAPSETCPDVGPPATPNHTPAGKFAKGNKASKGNPFARRMGALRTAVLDASGPEDVAAVVRALHRAAVGGDVAAAQVYLTFTVGRPRPAVDPDRLDLDEYAVLDSAPSRSRVFAVASEALDPAAAAALLRDTIPADDEGVTGRVLKIGKNENALIDARAEQRAKVGRK